MNRLKNLFRTLKNAGINSMFQEFNRRLVLGIATGDKTPKSPDTLPEIERMIQDHRNKLKHGDGDIETDMNFLRSYIESCESYRHCFIDISSYGAIIDYFVLKGPNVIRPRIVPASTLISTVADHDSFGTDDIKLVIHAIIIVVEDDDCITDETFGKIVKHELTHVLLEVMEFVLDTVSIKKNMNDGEPDADELFGFTEFLCDYIQCDSSVGPNEHPVAKFREIMKEYLTWVAADVYEPYLKIVEEYYAEEAGKETEEN